MWWMMWPAPVQHVVDDSLSTGIICGTGTICGGVVDDVVSKVEYVVDGSRTDEAGAAGDEHVAREGFSVGQQRLQVQCGVALLHRGEIQDERQA